MKTVWKFPCNLDEVNDNNQIVFNMPAGAKVISTEVQHGIVVIWAVIDDQVPEVQRRRFEFVGTGAPLLQSETKEYRFVGTVMLISGNLVWHVFEVIG